MRVLRFMSPTVAHGIPIYEPLSLVADRFLAASHGHDLHLYDLRDPNSPVVQIPEAVRHALAPSSLITANTTGILTRWELRAGTLRTIGCQQPCSPVPGTVDADLRIPSHMLLSPTGRYLLVEYAPLARNAKRGIASQVYLLDAGTGEVKRTFDLHLSWMRAGFASLPSAEEVLFISAESYMSVQFVACETGRTLYAFTNHRIPGTSVTPITCCQRMQHGCSCLAAFGPLPTRRVFTMPRPGPCLEIQYKPEPTCLNNWCHRGLQRTVSLCHLFFGKTRSLGAIWFCRGRKPRFLTTLSPRWPWSILHHSQLPGLATLVSSMMT